MLRRSFDQRHRNLSFVSPQNASMDFSDIRPGTSKISLNKKDLKQKRRPLGDKLFKTEEPCRNEIKYDLGDTNVIFQPEIEFVIPKHRKTRYRPKSGKR